MYVRMYVCLYVPLLATALAVKDLEIIMHDK